MSDDYRIPDEEWEQRELCSDGNCIGVIGPDGRCKECGQPGKGGPAPVDRGRNETEQAATDRESDTSPSPAAVEADAPDDDDWANRRLCPDGNCIGVIGPDGNCKECGRPAE